jgi:hypothetical protein
VIFQQKENLLHEISYELLWIPEFFMTSSFKMFYFVSFLYMCFVFLDRFDLREENRKDVLRTLYALIDEANTANWSSHGRPLQSNTVAATSS